MKKSTINNFSQEQGTQSHSQSDGLLTIKEAAGFLRVSPRNVWRLISGGNFVPTIKIGRCRRLLRSDLLQWLEGYKLQTN